MSVFSVARFVIRISLKIYFKEIQVEGREHVPTDSPILFTANHQNAFLDAFLVGAFSPAPVYFLTRSDVFTWWTKRLMKLIHMMPIYRIRDGYAKLTRNEAVFDLCGKLFSQKKSVLIFAEGNHGEHHYLRPLTKGAARLALQSQIKNKDLKIVPVGLNYFDHQQPNSKVIVVFGEPIPVENYVANFQKNSGAGLIELREAISSGMKSALVIPEKTDDYELIKKETFRKENEKLSFSELKSLPVRGGAYKAEKRPFHLISKLLNPIPFLIIWKIISGVDDIVFHSSLKFVTGMITFPLWWILIFFVFSWLYGIIIGAVVVFVMIASLLLDYKWSKL